MYKIGQICYINWLRINEEMKMFRKNYYAILEVNRTASPKEINDAYKRLMLLNHPDKNYASTAEANTKEIVEAHEVL